MTLNYKGQEIDICGADTLKYFNFKSKKWVQGNIELWKSEIKEIHELKIPVIPKAELITYKRNLGREVDIIDLTLLEK